MPISPQPNTMTNSNISGNRNKDFSTICGIDVYVAKKFAIFAFEDFHHSTKKNIKERRFDVLILKTIKVGDELVQVDEAMVKKFQKHFKGIIELILIQLEHIELYSK